jgi:hypothetical protein
VSPVAPWSSRTATLPPLPGLPSAYVADEVRLLGKTGGYTDKPSRALDPQEPEAVSREDQRRITADAARSWPHLSALHTAERSSLPLDRRIAQCKAQARHLGVDVHNELRLIKLTVSNGRSRAAVEHRVSVLERRLWPR